MLIWNQQLSSTSSPFFRLLTPCCDARVAAYKISKSKNWRRLSSWFHFHINFPAMSDGANTFLPYQCPSRTNLDMSLDMSAPVWVFGSYMVIFIWGQCGGLWWVTRYVCINFDFWLFMFPHIEVKSLKNERSETKNMLIRELGFSSWNHGIQLLECMRVVALCRSASSLCWFHKEDVEEGESMLSQVILLSPHRMQWTSAWV